MALLDGARLIESCLHSGGTPETVAVASSAMKTPEVRRILRRIPAAGVIELDDALFRELSTVESATGMLAVIRIPESAAVGNENFCVLIEDIQGPGNLGSILRSAAAAGAQAAYLSDHCADAWAPKVLRGGMGAHFLLGIHENADLAGTAKNFRGKVVAASLGAGKSLFEADLAVPVAFVIGNEGAGISGKLQQVASELVMIPMPGAVESLNAAAAAAICFFEKVRQQDASR